MCLSNFICHRSVPMKLELVKISVKKKFTLEVCFFFTFFLMFVVKV